MRLKLTLLSNAFAYRYWLKLHVQPEAIAYFSNTNHILYKNYTHEQIDGVDVGDRRSSYVTKAFAELGARSIDNAGPLQDLKGVLYKHMQPWHNGELSF